MNRLDWTTADRDTAEALRKKKFTEAAKAAPNPFEQDAQQAGAAVGFMEKASQLRAAGLASFDQPTPEATAPMGGGTIYGMVDPDAAMASLGGGDPAGGGLIDQFASFVGKLRSRLRPADPPDAPDPVAPTAPGPDLDERGFPVGSAATTASLDPAGTRLGAASPPSVPAPEPPHVPETPVQDVPGQSEAGRQRQHGDGVRDENVHQQTPAPSLALPVNETAGIEGPRKPGIEALPLGAPRGVERTRRQVAEGAKHVEEGLGTIKLRADAGDIGGVLAESGKTALSAFDTGFRAINLPGNVVAEGYKAGGVEPHLADAAGVGVNLLAQGGKPAVERLAREGLRFRQVASLGTGIAGAALGGVAGFNKDPDAPMGERVADAALGAFETGGNAALTMHDLGVPAIQMAGRAVPAAQTLASEISRGLVWAGAQFDPATAGIALGARLAADPALLNEAVRVYQVDEYSIRQAADLLGLPSREVAAAVDAAGVRRTPSQRSAAALDKFAPEEGSLRFPTYTRPNGDKEVAHSAYELVAMALLDQDAGVQVWTKKLGPEGRVPFTDADGIARTYTPDFFVQGQDGAKEVLEVKPDYRVVSDPLVLQKAEAARARYAEMGIGYRLVTEEQIGRDALRKFDPEQVPGLTPEQVKEVRRRLKSVRPQEYRQAAEIVTAFNEGNPAGTVSQRLSIVQGGDGGTGTYYHGTTTPFDRPDPSKFDPNGLFGPGYYLTDDPRVASGYAGRGESGPNVRKVDVPDNLRLLDADAPVGLDEYARVLRLAADRSGLPAAQHVARGAENALRLQRAGRDVPFDITGEILWGRLRGYVEGATTREKNAAVNQSLADAGYGGIRYAGGKRIPLDDAAGTPIEHDVVVVFGDRLGRLRNAVSGQPGGIVAGADTRTIVTATRDRLPPGTPADGDPTLSAFAKSLGSTAGRRDALATADALYGRLKPSEIASGRAGAVAGGVAGGLKEDDDGETTPLDRAKGAVTGAVLGGVGGIKAAQLTRGVTGRLAAAGDAWQAPMSRVIYGPGGEAISDAKAKRQIPGRGGLVTPTGERLLPPRPRGAPKPKPQPKPVATDPAEAVVDNAFRTLVDRGYGEADLQYASTALKRVLEEARAGKIAPEQVAYQAATITDAFPPLPEAAPLPAPDVPPVTLAAPEDTVDNAFRTLVDRGYGDDDLQFAANALKRVLADAQAGKIDAEEVGYQVATITDAFPPLDPVAPRAPEAPDATPLPEPVAHDAADLREDPDGALLSAPVDLPPATAADNPVAARLARQNNPGLTRRALSGAGEVRRQTALDAAVLAGKSPEVAAGIADESMARFAKEGSLSAREVVDTDAFRRLLRDVRNERVAEAGRRVQGFRYGNLLSGTSGAIGDTIGNLLNTAYQSSRAVVASPIEDFFESRGTITRAQRANTANEWRGMSEGLATGWIDAWSDAVQVLSEGRSPVRTEMAPSLLGGRKDAAARAVDFGYRLRVASDVFFSAIGERMWTHALAFREADRKGLKAGTPEYAAFAGNVVARVEARLAGDPKLRQGGTAEFGNLDALAEEVKNRAMRNIFQGELGTAGKALSGVRGDAGVIGWFVPFFKTLWGVASEGVGATPVGTAGTLLDLGRAQIGRGPYNADNLLTVGTAAVPPATERLAGQVLGSGVIATSGVLTMLGLLTDGGPTDPDEYQALYDSGWRPYAIHVGDTYTPIDRVLGSAGLPLMFGAALVGDYARQGRVDTNALLEFSEHMAAGSFDQSGLRSFLDMLSLFKRGQFGQGWKQLASSQAGSLVPHAGLLRQLSYSTDPTLRDPQGFVDRVRQAVPLGADVAVAGAPFGLDRPVPTRLDPIGDEIARSPGQSGARAFLPFQSSSDRTRGDDIRRYLGSTSAAEDVRIGKAIDRVDKWRARPDQYPEPTDAEFELWAVNRRAENPAYQRLHGLATAEDRRRRTAAR